MQTGLHLHACSLLLPEVEGIAILDSSDEEFVEKTNSALMEELQGLMSEMKVSPGLYELYSRSMLGKQFFPFSHAKGSHHWHLGLFGSLED